MIYEILDLTNYNREIILPNGHEIKFKGHLAKVDELDLTYFKDSDDYEVVGKPLAKEVITYSPFRAVINGEGLMYGASGFAEAMRNIVYYLYKNKVRVTAKPHDTSEADSVDILNTTKGKVIEELTKIRYADENDMPHINLQMTIPRGVTKSKDSYTIGYVMFETVKWPKKFLDHLEENADELWTPSNFNVDNIKKAGWDKPIYRMQLGVDSERFDPSLYKSFTYNESPIGYFKDKFIFLSIMGWSERKGVSSLVEAYLKEFAGDEHVVLYLKGGWYDLNNAKMQINNLIKKYNPKNPPLIYLDFTIYTDEEHPRLYKSASAFILASLGEGWGLNYTEAMSMELPTIGTAATSMLDFMDNTNSFPIKVERYAPEPRCDWVCGDYIGESFAHPDIKSIQKQMRYVFKNQNKAKEVGKKARQDMITKWSWDIASEKHIKRLREITQKS